MSGHNTRTRDEQLDTIIAEYLEVSERDADPPDENAWIVRYPEFAIELREFFGDQRVARRAYASLDDVTPVISLQRARRFGDYELIDEIGRGGMGIIYMARQRSLNRIVAVKTIIGGQVASDSDVRRFRTEAEAAAKLQHPNIVTVHEVGEHKGQHFFSMEYVKGTNLGEKVRDHPLEPRTAARYVKAIAEAIQCAHEHGILHRDLKPTNVLLDSSDRPRITDFGLAKLMEHDSSLTVSGAVVGTPGYMAPEQAAGKPSEVTTLSDVYSLGAILYECLTSRPPFRGDTPVEVISQVINADPVAPRALDRSIPVDLETICMRCLVKEPQKRYGSAKALAADLQRFLDGQPIHARPIGEAARVWRWLRRNPLPTSLVLAAVVLLVLIDLWSFWERIEERKAHALDSNASVAQSVAETVGQQLRHLSSAVARASKDSTLLDVLSGHVEGAFRAKERSRLQGWIETTHRYYADPANGFRWPGDHDPFVSWFVMDIHGQVLAHSTHPPMRDIFALRDYFRGALALRNPTSTSPTYISKVYRATRADRFYKFGISTLVRSDNRAVGVIVATVTTASTAGSLLSRNAQQEAVLVGPWDRSSQAVESRIVSGSPTNLILWHPAYRSGDAAVEMRNEKLAGLQVGTLHPKNATDDNYRDPLSKTDGRYAGRWLAAFAPVGGSELIVIVQSKYNDTIRPHEILDRALILGGGAVLGLLLLVVTASLRRRFQSVRA